MFCPIEGIEAKSGASPVFVDIILHYRPHAMAYPYPVGKRQGIRTAKHATEKFICRSQASSSSRSLSLLGVAIMEPGFAA